MARPSLISPLMAELARKERQRRQSSLTSSTTASSQISRAKSSQNENASRTSTPGPGSLDKGERYLQLAIEKIRRKYAEQNQVLARTNSQCIAKIRSLEDRVDELLRENAQLRALAKQQQKPQKVHLDRAMRTVEDSLYDRFVEIFDVFRDIRIEEDLPDNEKINIFRLHRELEEALTSTPIDGEGSLDRVKFGDRERVSEPNEKLSALHGDNFWQPPKNLGKERLSSSSKMAPINGGSRERSQFDSDDDLNYIDEKFIEGETENENVDLYEDIEEQHHHKEQTHGDDKIYETVEEVYNQEIDANYEKEVEEFRRKEARKEEETRKLLAMMHEVELNLKHQEEMKKKAERIKKQQEEEQRIEQELLQKRLENERLEELKKEELRKEELRKEELKKEEILKERARKIKAEALIKKAKEKETQSEGITKDRKSTEKVGKSTAKALKSYIADEPSTSEPMEQENVELLRKRPRRATKEVNYKTPSLNRKLRRKSNVLFTAVGEEERRPLANITNKGN